VPYPPGWLSKRAKKPFRIYYQHILPDALVWQKGRPFKA